MYDVIDISACLNWHSLTPTVVPIIIPDLKYLTNHIAKISDADLFSILIRRVEVSENNMILIKAALIIHNRLLFMLFTLISLRMAITFHPSAFCFITLSYCGKLLTSVSVTVILLPQNDRASQNSLTVMSSELYLSFSDYFWAFLPIIRLKAISAN